MEQSLEKACMCQLASQLPWEYIHVAQLLPFRRIGLIKHNNQLCPHRYPFSPG